MAVLETSIFGSRVKTNYTAHTNILEFMLAKYIDDFDGDVEVGTARMNLDLKQGIIEIKSEDVVWCKEDRGEGYVDVRYSIVP